MDAETRTDWLLFVVYLVVLLGVVGCQQAVEPTLGPGMMLALKILLGVVLAAVVVVVLFILLVMVAGIQLQNLTHGTGRDPRLDVPKAKR